MDYQRMTASELHAEADKLEMQAQASRERAANLRDLARLREQQDRVMSMLPTDAEPKPEPASEPVAESTPAPSNPFEATAQRFQIAPHF